MGLIESGFTFGCTAERLASLVDALLARHAIFPGEERLRDESKERLRGRLLKES